MKKILVVVIAVLVVAGGVGAYVFYSSSSDQDRRLEAYCGYAEDFNDAVRELERNSGMSSEDVPQEIVDQQITVRGLADNSSGELSDKWAKFDEYLQLLIEGYEDDFSRGEEMMALSSDAFSASLAGARSFREDCNISMQGSLNL